MSRLIFSRPLFRYTSTLNTNIYPRPQRINTTVPKSRVEKPHDIHRIPANVDGEVDWNFDGVSG
jgi:hypothetical protein